MDTSADTLHETCPICKNGLWWRQSK